MGWAGWGGQNSITESSCTAPPLPSTLTPYPPNDITISCKGCSHHPSCSTNRSDIYACLFQPIRNTDPTGTANRNTCCCHGNSILGSLLSWGASFNSITEQGETVSQRVHPCNTVLRSALSSYTDQLGTVHCYTFN